MIHRKETKDFLVDYFEKRDIFIETVNFVVKCVDDYQVCKNSYTINLPKNRTYAEVIEE